MVAGAASDALLTDFQDALRKALEHGTTLAEFRRDFYRIVEKHGWEYNGSRNWRSRIMIVFTWVLNAVLGKEIAKI